MKSQFRWLILLALIAGASAVWKLERAASVRNRGRSIERWFDELNSDGPATNAARTAILALGSNAVPYLMTQLTNAPPFRENYLHYKEQIPWAFRKKLPAIPRINWNRRERAALMLGELGPTAKAAFPTLIDLISHMDRAEVLGPNESNARTWNPHLRIAAFIAMGQIDSEDPRLPGAIAKALKGGNPLITVDTTILQAARTFERIKKPSDETIRKILKCLEERNSDIYAKELEYFCGPLIPGGSTGHSFHEINSVTNTLIALTSTDKRVREAAAFEFGDPDREGYEMRPTPRPLPVFPDEVVTNLVQCLHDPVELVRLNAAETLFKLKRSQDEILPVLISLLDSTNSFNQLRTIEILRLLGKVSRPALPKLTMMKSDSAAFLARWAERASEEIR